MKSRKLLKELTDVGRGKSAIASVCLVKRVYRKVLEALRHITAGLEESWEEWVPHVVASISSYYNSSTGESPLTS